ncbi:coenzyme F420-0:L-glutamate ligase [Lactobacillus kimbladii]|uniref:coenzyme F420-0:L-glutamate ligase n=1 Tax=Lactobacillus kimbladii TaxID=1218506 RepID=UPI0024745552|nr:coenzyme F420-0:L-glutamate ligase [Lactobacillus kimbladii]
METVKKEHFQIAGGDIICVASKICSLAEGDVVDLKQVVPTSLARKIQQRISRKDERLIQVIIYQASDPTGSKLEISGNHIGAWLPNGLFLTSCGVDKGKNNTAITLPKNCDLTAKRISNAFCQELVVKTSMIITDSDGRADKKGANQVAVGLYGLNGLRTNNKTGTSETLCDLLAAAAGLVMGQRGINIPLACIHGLEYEKATDFSIADTVN